jgi:hypothetical protein
MNMKKIFIGLILLLLAAAAAFLITNCGDLEESMDRGDVTSLSISPDSASLEAGDTQIFSAVAEYSDGTSSSVSAGWSVRGDIGGILAVGLNALFTASTEGSGTVEATYGSLAATAEITVTGAGSGAGLATIEVAPSQEVVRVNAEQTFTAAGRNSSGEAVAIAPVWVLSGEAVGTLTSSGTTATLEASAEGNAIICCISGEVTGYAYVTVEGYTIDITVESDTYVGEDDPATHESDVLLKGGYVSATGKYFEAYFKFPLALIPTGASVEAVTLRVYPSSVGSSDLQFRRLNFAFSAATTWETRPTPLGSLIVSGTFTAGDYNNVSGDNLTALVREWRSGAVANYGLALVQDGATDGVVVILSKEDGSNPPILRVEYTE